MNETVAKRVQDLVAGGALIQRPGGMDTVGFARVTDRSVGWCVMFPEDQHHVHNLFYSAARVRGGRDVAFYDGKEMIAYMAPYREWQLQDEGRFLLERENWNRYLGEMGNRERLHKFFLRTLKRIGG